MKDIKSFPNFNGFAFLRALPKAVNTAEIKSNAVNNAKLRYEGYKKLSEMYTTSPFYQKCVEVSNGLDVRYISYNINILTLLQRITRCYHSIFWGNEKY